MRLGSAIAVALLVSSAAAAEDVTLALPAGATAVELYAAPGVDDVKVSGAMLVGVHLSGGLGMFDIERLRIARPTSIRSVCLQITTIDGRYLSLNGLVARSGSGEIGRVELGSRYAKILGRYRASDVAVRATTSAECTDRSEGDILPVVGFPESGVIELLVNSGSSKVAIRKDAASFSACRPISGRATVAFNNVCTIDATSANGSIEVEIATIGLTGRQAKPSRYTVRLPAR